MSKQRINLGGDESVEVALGPDVNLDEEPYSYDGQQLTEETAEQLGASRGGRPHLDPSRQPSTHVACRVTVATANQLDEVARATGRRRSQVLRDALDAYLKAS